MDLLNPINHFYESKEEPAKSCLLAARHFILHFIPQMTESWKYGMPFFCYKGKIFCYLWIDKKTKQPYLGIMDGYKLEHPLLLQEKRARVKILMLEVEEDLPIALIAKFFRQLI